MLDSFDQGLSLLPPVTVIGTARPGAKSSAGFENILLIKSTLQVPLKSAMPQGCALHFPIKIKYTGTSRELFYLGGLRLNLPEFTWSVSCSIVTDQRGRRANMTIEYTSHVLDILS